MGILSEIGSFAVAGGSGGILGVFGSALNRGFSFFEKKADRKHALALAEINREKQAVQNAHEVRLHDLNIEKLNAETEKEILVTNAAGSWEGLKASHATAGEEAKKFNGSPWVENVKATTRPFLTYSLWVLVFIAFKFVSEEMRVSVLETMVFCASASTLWWFGDRAPKYKSLQGHGS